MTKDIKGKVKDLHDEIWCAQNVVKNIISSLETCDDNTNLTQKIGIYARQMPEFKILAEKRVACISIIRQVCTGEISVEKSLKLFHTAEKQLNEALECINLWLQFQFTHCTAMGICLFLGISPSPFLQC